MVYREQSSFTSFDFASFPGSNELITDKRELKKKKRFEQLTKSESPVHSYVHDDGFYT